MNRMRNAHWQSARHIARRQSLVAAIVLSGWPRFCHLRQVATPCPGGVWWQVVTPCPGGVWRVVCSLFALALLTAVCVASTRDPFAIPAVARCERLATERLSWQLQGVIGRPGDFSGWLVAAAGKRLRLRQGEVLPGTRWQVREITRFSVLLNADHDCPPPLMLRLKEGNRVQSVDPAAGTDQPPAG